METVITLSIRKRSQPGWLAAYLLLLPFLLGTLNDLLGLPYAIRYSLDAVWLVLLVYLARFRRSVELESVRGLAAWVLVFLAYTALVYLVQYQSALYFLWGVRNNFRFYVAFFAFAAFLTREGAENYYSLLDRLFWVNAAVSIVQYFLLGIKGDYLGGIFGTGTGVNGYTNLFFIIVLAKSLVFYLEKREKPWLCAAKCAAALLVAALAELKFFFVEFLMIIALAVLVTDFSWRKFWVILGGTAAVAVGAALLAAIFPGYGDWFSLEWMLEAASSDRGYTSSGDLNRLTAIAGINERWLKNWGQRLFGLGLGNCDTSSFAILNTPFYQANSQMHYTWIGYAFLYLETGYVGLLFCFGFFALVFFSAYQVERHSEGVAKTHCRVARILAVCCVLLAVYNASLRAEPAYMAAFALAAPFVQGRKLRGRARHEDPVLR